MRVLVCLVCVLISVSASAQVRTGRTNRPTPDTEFDPARNNPNRRSETQKDTMKLQQRDDLKDSITISFRYLDSTRRVSIDSSVNDFDTYFSLPSNYTNLGNNGAAAFPLIFEPLHKPGFDAGFHAYDVYRFKMEETKIYRTTRPFSMLAYQLASGKEQMIQAAHTQNPRPNVNFGFDYRLISAPGLFVTQNSNHNNFRLFGNYQGRRKRYSGTVVLLGNTLRASQNGGIVNDSMLDDPNRKDRFSVPVNLGGSAQFRNNPFVTTVNTGIMYRDFSFLLRQSYDLGKRDSIAVNDSTTEYLFYPKLRIQHTLTTSSNSYRYTGELADSAKYREWYGLFPDTIFENFSILEKWSVLSNDLSLVQFPDTKNSAQFLMVGATLENIKGNLATGNVRLHNIMAHGEYRNRTRNRKWDMLLKGVLYANGYNSGDFQAHARLARYINKTFGDVSLFFTNTGRSPSFIHNDIRSAFNLAGNAGFKKEIITSFGGEANNAFLTFGVKNHLISNYIYYRTFTVAEQESQPVNILQLYASKKIRLSRRLNWYVNATVQHSGANSIVRVPNFFTRNRLAFEGRFFKNLLLSTGIEARYYSPFKANNYSPLIGQFVLQDSIRIKNTPDVAAFFHFRIKTFTGYIRAENLNTISFSDGFGFTKNNFSSPHYPTPGLMIRFGIKWWFVN